MPVDNPRNAWTAAPGSGLPGPSGSGLLPENRTPASAGSVFRFSREEPCAPRGPEQTGKQYTAGRRFRLPATWWNTCNPQYRTAVAVQKFPTLPARVQKSAGRSGESPRWHASGAGDYWGESAQPPPGP